MRTYRGPVGVPVPLLTAGDSSSLAAVFTYDQTAWTSYRWNAQRTSSVRRVMFHIGIGASVEVQLWQQPHRGGYGTYHFLPAEWRYRGACRRPPARLPACLPACLPAWSCRARAQLKAGSQPSHRARRTQANPIRVIKSLKEPFPAPCSAGQWPRHGSKRVPDPGRRPAHRGGERPLAACCFCHRCCWAGALSRQALLCGNAVSPSRLPVADPHPAPPTPPRIPPCSRRGPARASPRWPPPPSPTATARSPSRAAARCASTPASQLPLALLLPCCCRAPPYAAPGGAAAPAVQLIMRLCPFPSPPPAAQAAWGSTQWLEVAVAVGPPYQQLLPPVAGLLGERARVRAAAWVLSAGCLCAVVCAAPEPCCSSPLALAGKTY